MIDMFEKRSSQPAVEEKADGGDGGDAGGSEGGIAGGD